MWVTGGEFRMRSVCSREKHGFINKIGKEKTPFCVDISCVFTHGESPLRLRAAKFDIAIEQLGFFRMPHLLWHGSSVYNGHLQRPVILTSVAERLAVELSLTIFFDLGLPRLWFVHPTFRMQGEHSNRLRYRRGHYEPWVLLKI